LAPQLFVNVAVAVHVVAAVPVLVSLMVCSRAEPDVPQPLHAHVPPDTGCGPRTTVEPVFSEAADCTAQAVVPLMFMKGVVALGWHVCAHAGALSAASVSSTLFFISIVVLFVVCRPGSSGPFRKRGRAWLQRPAVVEAAGFGVWYMRRGCMYELIMRVPLRPRQNENE
jgi:hypothetical protein